MSLGQRAADGSAGCSALELWNLPGELGTFARRLRGSHEQVAASFPDAEKPRVASLTTEQLNLLKDVMPPELRALVALATGTGMRQGEVLGLTRDRRRLLSKSPELTVDRQIATKLGGTTVFGPTNTRAWNRVISLPRVVIAALNNHIARSEIGDGELLFTHPGAPADAPAVRTPVVAGCESGRADRGDRRGNARAAQITREPVHPARRVDEDGSGAPRPQVSDRDAGHLRAHVGGF